MGISTRILHFYLIIFFSYGEGRFQHIDKKTYVSKPSGDYHQNSSSLTESQIPRKTLSFSHNAVKEIPKRKVEGSLNLLCNQSSEVEPIAILVNSLPQEVPYQKPPQTLSQIDGMELSLQDTTEPPRSVEKLQGATSLPNANPMLKWSGLGHIKQDAHRTVAFPPSRLRRAVVCGIPVNGVLDLSHRKLTESELRQKVGRHCKATLNKITEFNVSHNYVNIHLTDLILLLLKMTEVQSINVSYNQVTLTSAHMEKSCKLRPSKLLFLNLSHNPLDTLENLCLPSTVKSIDLSFTHIHQIPEKFGIIFFHLEEMYVQGNQLIYHGARDTSACYSGRSRLSSKPFTVSYISIPKETPIRSLPRAVKHLELSHCSIVELPEWFVQNMTRLFFLDLSNNPMHTFPQLPTSLQYLDLSNSHIKRIAVLSHFSNLTVLNIQNNKITHFSSAYLPDSLKELDISRNKIRTFPFQKAQHNIESLNISGNLLQQLNLSSPYSSLNNLDASCNLIGELLGPMGDLLPELKYLNLSRNKISFLQPGFLPESLLELDISNNVIIVIMKDTFDHLTNLNVLTIQGKHFFCSCDLYWFANTYLSTPGMQINGREHLRCGFPLNKKGLLLEESTLTLLSCSLGLQLVIMACVAILVMSIITALCWHLDGLWYIRMGWYWCMAKRKQYKKRPEQKPYDAFISYSENDALWTKEILLEKLEANGFRVCYHERDFMPGHPVLGNIFHCIENSHKVLFVLSPSFVNSSWCQYELYFAEHQVLNENQDSLIMVVLEDLPCNSIPQKFSKLRKLLKRKTYLKWSPEQHKQKLFWSQLTAVLKTTNEPVVLKEENGLHQKTDVKLKGHE
ncbi:toll-like receptor 2 [Hemicordylus capensis]|uniref:toll-like receptor 2 n=1 Tax=Hemicordylus capensis TaxID=884348 RepID=UPI002302969C|nr:toll-like receptor 2 [Hemicordylus capensis]